jgi:hypothetical protein
LRKLRIHTAHPEVEFQPEEHEAQATEPARFALSTPEPH